MSSTRLILASYDTGDRSLRRLFSEVCKDFGLRRVQLSVFGGRLTDTQFKSFKVRLKFLVNSKRSVGRLLVIPVGHSALSEGLMIHKEDPRVSIADPAEVWREKKIEDWVL